VGPLRLNKPRDDLYLLIFIRIHRPITLRALLFALAPLVLGFILGPIAETNLRRALMTDEDPTLFFTPHQPDFPVAGVFVFPLSGPFRSHLKKPYIYRKGQTHAPTHDPAIRRALARSGQNVGRQLNPSRPKPAVHPRNRRQRR